MHSSTPAGIQSTLRPQQHRHHVEARRRRRREDTTDEKWAKMHEKLSQELSVADEGRGYDVLFYGDSIFESTQ
jgi:hypothetical protein